MQVKLIKNFNFLQKRSNISDAYAWRKMLKCYLVSLQKRALFQ